MLGKLKIEIKKSFTLTRLGLLIAFMKQSFWSHLAWNKLKKIQIETKNEENHVFHMAGKEKRVKNTGTDAYIATSFGNKTP